MIEGQLIYLGPRLHSFGVGYGMVFHNGIHRQLQAAIKLCPSIAGLLIPVKDASKVLRELKFDYAHRMNGTTGKHVTFYREIQNWLNSQQRKPNTTPNLEVKHHA